MASTITDSRPPKNPSQQAHGIHLVGSFPTHLHTTEDVFRYTFSHLPASDGKTYLTRIPDGETGDRANFTMWQFALFPAEAFPSFGARPPATPSDAEIAAAVAKLPSPLETGYDTAAIESYAAFAKLKTEGVIPPATRFQVCIPSPVGTIVILEPAYRAALEPAYIDGLHRALGNIQAAIPASELAVQIDVAPDMGLIEGDTGVPWLTPYWDGDQFEGVVTRLLDLVAQVAAYVQLGFHFCYGDIQHQHFKEPADTGTAARLITALRDRSTRSVDWVHLPVPRERDDVAYFAPLAGVELGETKLFLGLVHPRDEEGTLRRVKAAREAGVTVDFGVATECGMGRTPEGDLDEIFRVAKAVAGPYPDTAAAAASVPTPALPPQAQAVVDEEEQRVPDTAAAAVADPAAPVVGSSDVDPPPSTSTPVERGTKSSWRRSLSKRLSIFRSSK